MAALLWHWDCSSSGMMDVALSMLALIAGGVTLELFVAARAPLGYQDQHGFHAGIEPLEDSQSGNPS